MATGRLVILSGPSGVGKDTVIDRWKLADPNVVRVVAYTTRNPRVGEVDGVDYRFVTADEFKRMAEDGEFLEHMQVVDNFYATPSSDTNRLLEEGRIAILKIDVQGALEVMEKRPDALTVFILPPCIEDLRMRLQGRATDSAEVIERRLTQAEQELAVADRYQHRIVNENVDDVVAKLLELTDS